MGQPVIGASSSSKSSRKARHPSTIRNASPNGSCSAGISAAALPVAELGHRVDAQRAEPLLRARSISVVISATIRRGLVGVAPGHRRRRRRAAARPARRACHHRGRGSRTATSLGRVRERQRHDQRAQHGRLAGLRATDDDAVPGAAGEVRPQQIPPLLERPVDDAERHLQPAVAEDPTGGQAAIVGGG